MNLEQRIINFMQEMQVSEEYIISVSENLEYNKTISEYFELLYHETGELNFLTLANNLHSCNNRWFFDDYRESKILDLKNMFLCHNRFCMNCAKMMQASRLRRFAPPLDATSETHDLYHITFTVPNVPKEKYATTVSIIFKAFYLLNRFFKGKDKIKGLDLSFLGYEACIRSLETTFNKYNKDYHPHLHCIFAFKKGLVMPKTITNKFSYDTKYNPITHKKERVFVSHFSEFEVLLQKLWRAIYDLTVKRTYVFGGKIAKPLPQTDSTVVALSAAEKQNNTNIDVNQKKKVKGKQEAVTLNYIKSLDEGYSCKVNLIGWEYFEVFKYAFKLWDDERNIIDYNQFKTLYYGLKGKKTIQGYGAWFNLKCDDEIDESVHEFYYLLTAYLRQREKPVEISLTPDETLEHSREHGYSVITRRSIQKDLNQLTDEEKQAIAQSPLTPLPQTDKPKFRIPDLAAAYLRYTEHKKTSDIFADVRKAIAQKYSKQEFVLTDEQLNYFNSLFA